MHTRAHAIYGLVLLAILLPFRAHSAENSIKLTTVVIDAGHGGNDPGAVSKDQKTYEKNLTLKIAKAAGEKIRKACPDVKVIYTRTTDVYLTLNERAEIANRNKANLFISIHINANESRTPDGFSAHILGESSNKNRDLFAYNMNVCKRENSVILLEDDYSTKYQGFDPNDPESFIFFHLMQNAFYEQSLLFAADVNKSMGEKSGLRHNRGISQDPFYVLWKTTMPAVLVEAGFISNAEDLSLMRSENGPDRIASAIADAFCVFKARYDGSVEITGKAAVEKSAPLVDKPAPVVDKSAQVVEKPAEKPQKTVAESAGKAVQTLVEKPAPVRDTTAVRTCPAAVRYGVQILASPRIISVDDPVFKGYKPLIYNVGEMNKYIIAESESIDDVKKSFAELVKIFPDSFMVKITGEEVKFWGRRL